MIGRFGVACQAALIVLVGTSTSISVSAQSISAQVPSNERAKSVRADTADPGSTDARVAEEVSTPLNSSDDRTETTMRNAPKFFLHDQQAIWTSPARVRFPDATWLVPLGGITAGLFVTDHSFSKHLSLKSTTINHYKTLSDAGVATLIGGAGGMWALGHLSHNDHWSETGFLAGESVLNSLVLVEGLKYSLRRQRPYQGNGGGSFFKSGGTSFPSEHAAAAWSVAGVIAHEYPGPLTKIVAYGLATLVDYSRVRARQHFPSDVLVGSVIGNLVAQNIYSRHHNPELGGGAWRSIGDFVRGDGERSPADQGSPYVPLDSWIYPALDRLSAMGAIESGFAGLRPWTRRECARLLSEAEERIAGAGEEDSELQSLLTNLRKELRPETESAREGDGGGAFRLESVYSRAEYISGMPLNDGFHFAQTVFNDFGRPYGEGWNNVTGFSAYATAGRWSGYLRGELQIAPSVPALPLTARQTNQQVDSLPILPPGTPQPSVDRFNLLEGYVGLMLSNWQVSFGKQSLSWGPGNGGSLTLSNNAPPINMFRVSRTTPFKLPSILGWLGPIRTEVFFGQLTGHEFLLNPSGFVGQFGHSLSPQPFIHGQKMSFKPTPNFEFGFFRTTIYGGPGYPLTLHTFLRSLLSTGNTVAGAPNKPGKRTSGLDFSYRLPGLRNWLTFYGDGLAYDEFSPIAYADRSAWRAGLYLSQFPRFHKLDLRVEGLYTDNPLGGKLGRGFYYANATWESGYTNGGYLLGSWVGREGQGALAWTNYWFNPRNRLQFNFRHQKISQKYIPGGGTLTDGGVRADFCVRSAYSVTASVQYERWAFPVIFPTEKGNLTTSVQLMFWPRAWGKRAVSAVGNGDYRLVQ
jgi:membrane-associated phospholipid phosphatase